MTIVEANMQPANSLIVSVSGVRGIIGETLTPEVAVRFAAAFGATMQGKHVVLSRDGRPSGTMMRHAVLAGLLGAGCTVDDIGVAPTPTFGVAIPRLNAAGGIQITASHNPAPWNGLKLFDSEGKVLDAGDGKRIQHLFEAGTAALVSWDRLGTCTDCPVAADWHRERVLQLVDVSRIRNRSFRVFLDANGGAGGPLGRNLLESFGCQVTPQGCEADGLFLHEPEPTAANLVHVCPLVPQHAAEIGFVLDPDADRLALIDEQGRYIGEELTLALTVCYRLQHERGPIVVNMSTSRVNEDLARRAGVPFHRAAVGEANVVQKMKEVGALLGGEGNGGVIDPRVGWVRDPFIGMGMILNLMAETGSKLSQLVEQLPCYTIVKDKYEVSRERLPALFTALQQRWPEATASCVDGLRLDWQDRWIHVRGSNTEPIIRVIAEAPTAGVARQLCKDVGAML
jgi:phosphomannomutase